MALCLWCHWYAISRILSSPSISYGPSPRVRVYSLDEKSSVRTLNWQRYSVSANVVTASGEAATR